MADPRQTVSVIELQKYPIFQDLTPVEVMHFLRSARVRSFARGAVIVRQGTPGDGMYIVLSGELDVYTTDNLGRRHLLGTLGEGDFVGEMSLLDQKARAATAEARGDARCIFLGRDAFVELQRTDAAVLNKILLRMMSEMSARLRTLGQRYVMSKTALGGF